MSYIYIVSITKEPSSFIALFIRATMDRILTLPDLAGLTGRCARPAAPTTSTGYKRPMPYGGREREKGPSSSTRKHKKQVYAINFCSLCFSYSTENIILRERKFCEWVLSIGARAGRPRERGAQSDLEWFSEYISY